MAEKLTTEATSATYSLLENTPLFEEVGGKFFKGSKTKNFTGESVVINALPMTGDQHQLCIVNVNVFVPNLVLETSEGIDRTQANYARITVLGKLVRQFLNEYYYGDHSWVIEQEYTQVNEGFDEHFINFRVRFRNINI